MKSGNFNTVVIQIASTTPSKEIFSSAVFEQDGLQIGNFTARTFQSSFRPTALPTVAPSVSPTGEFAIWCYCF